MASVPNTTTFRLTDVTAIIDSTNLISAFAGAIPAFFDSNYSGAKNSLLNFRNYTTAVAPPPVITLVGADTLTLVQNGTYTEYGATAFDSVDGNITGSILVTGSVNMAITGTYYRYYNVTNSNSVPAVQVVRTIVVSAAASAIVCLYGAADYINPVNYGTVVLTAAGGYSKNCLSDLGVAMGSTSSISSIKFPNTLYRVRAYDNGYPSTDVDFSGQEFVLDNTCIHLNNFNYYHFPDNKLLNDNIRSLCVELIAVV